MRGIRETVGLARRADFHFACVSAFDCNVLRASSARCGNGMCVCACACSVVLGTEWFECAICCALYVVLSVVLYVVRCLESQTACWHKQRRSAQKTYLVRQSCRSLRIHSLFDD